MYLLAQPPANEDQKSRVCHRKAPLLLRDASGLSKVMDRSEVTNFRNCCCRSGWRSFFKGAISKKILRLI